LAKAIVLRRDAGYMFAVLPASHHLRISDLRNQLGDDVEMAKEAEIDPLFPDLRARGSSVFSAVKYRWSAGAMDIMASRANASYAPVQVPMPASQNARLSGARR
jgi:hypothetical protein